MAVYEYVSPCHFGLEAVLKREITDLGFEIVSVEDGRVTYRCGSARQYFSAHDGAGSFACGKV